MPLPSFFDEPAPPAVLKHGLLRRYLHVFATKTGAKPPHRVVYVDGYAGAGRYRDGTDGSPRIAMQTRDELSRLGGKGPRDLDCLFIEESEEVAAELVRHVPRERVRTGRVQEHLDEILEHAEGVPLLLFLDPYGMTLDTRTIAERLLRRGRGPGRVPTEVLVNFATHTVRREGGHMNSESPTPAAPKIIEGMNQFLDGTWWQGLWGKSPEADRAIAEGWGQRIEGRAPSFKAFSMGVPRRWEGDPLYYLTLVTEHPQGGWFFADSLRGSVKDFYRFDVGDRPQLFDPDYRGAEAVEVIAANLRRLVDERGTVRLGHVTRELYGEVLGFAGAKEVRKAVKLLHHRGLVDHDGAGELHNAAVGPGHSMSLI